MLACQRGCQRGRRRTAEPRGDARRRTRPAREVPLVVSRNVADARTFVGSAASCAVAARAPRRNQKSRARSPGGIKRRFVPSWRKSPSWHNERRRAALETPASRATERARHAAVRSRREGRQTRNGHDVRERRGRQKSGIWEGWRTTATGTRGRRRATRSHFHLFVFVGVFFVMHTSRATRAVAARADGICCAPRFPHS